MLLIDLLQVNFILADFILFEVKSAAFILQFVFLYLPNSDFCLFSFELIINKYVFSQRHPVHVTYCIWNMHFVKHALL